MSMEVIFWIKDHQLWPLKRHPFIAKFGWKVKCKNCLYDLILNSYDPLCSFQEKNWIDQLIGKSLAYIIFN